MSRHQYTQADHLLSQLDQAVSTLWGKPETVTRPFPGAQEPEAELDDKTRDQVARLMRINHTGEICAQALYQGQAVTAKNPSTRESMQQSAAEERDHLQWCEQRVKELGGRLSLLNPAFYAASFTLGALAGVVGDKWSLGFVAETEKQVEGHLDKHLAKIPMEDNRTRHTLRQMKEDEVAHGQKALAQGGAELPLPIKLVMRIGAKCMTRSVYHI